MGNTLPGPNLPDVRISPRPPTVGLAARFRKSKMSKKRSLYHRAPSQTPPPQVSKSLVQGRLITEPLSPITVSVSQGPLSRTTEGHRGSQSTDPLLTPSKVSVSLPLFSPATAVNRKQWDANHQEPTSSPLQQQLHDQASACPPHIQPSASLSLTDSDDEPRVHSVDKMPHAHRVSEQLHVEKQAKAMEPTSQSSPSVLLVDASGRSQSPTCRDVPVLTSIVNSQVKVVCHSPRGKISSQAQRSPRTSGNTAQAANIKVDSVPCVNMLDANVDIRERSPSERSEDASVASVSSIAGSPVDGRGARASRARQDEDEENNTEQYKSFLGDIRDQPEPPLSAYLSQAEIRQQLFDTSAFDTSTMMAHDLSLASSHDKILDSKKKKSKARAVPSRYMSKTAKGGGTKDSSRAPNSRVKPPATKTRALDVSHHGDLHGEVDVITPFLRHDSSKSGRIVASTPAIRYDVPTADSVADAISRVPSGSVTAARAGSSDFLKPAVSVPKAASQRAPLPASARKAAKSKGGRTVHAADTSRTYLNKPMHASLVEVRGEDGDVSQRQLELEHARLLQWIFLNSKLKDSMERQEKEARAQMFSVWQENETLRREISNLEHEHAAMTKNSVLEGQLDVQLSGLQPIGDNMAKLILQYAQLSDALDTTRHHMPVDGVLIPHDHDSLLVAIDESERLLGEIDALTKQQQTEASSLAKEMDILNTTTDAERREQERCEELLSAASTLRTQECSLQAQTIQKQLTVLE